MSFKTFFSAVTLIAGLSVGASASALTITSIDGEWQNVSAGVSGVGTDKIRWGKGWKGGGQSGYDFNATTTELNASDGEMFSLGSFDHRNLPVTGTFLKSVDLAVSFTIDGMTNAISSVFSFGHTETYNRKRGKCANGERNYSDRNANGCADRVSATLNEAKTETFQIDGVTYILDVLGFHYAGELMTDFWTVEKEVNSAELKSVISGSNAPLRACWQATRFRWTDCWGRRPCRLRSV